MNVKQVNEEVQGYENEDPEEADHYIVCADAFDDILT